MTDPTYDRARIDADVVWELAFSLSEIMNDNAPIGWAKYIPIAECLLVGHTIVRKDRIEGKS